MKNATQTASKNWVCGIRSEPETFEAFVGDIRSLPSTATLLVPFITKLHLDIFDDCDL
jgi:hypothetical protein